MRSILIMVAGVALFGLCVLAVPLVGGEPDEILPYLQRAAKSGLKRPQLSASLAKVEIDLNHFQAGYNAAADALSQSPKEPAYWDTYVRAAFGLEIGRAHV